MAWLEDALLCLKNMLPDEVFVCALVLLLAIKKLNKKVEHVISSYIRSSKVTFVKLANNFSVWFKSFKEKKN